MSEAPAGIAPGAQPAQRLFFALWPSPAVRTAIRRSAGAAVRMAGGRPVPAANYHLTLAFLGAQPAERLGAIAGAAEAAGVPAGRLVLSRIGCFERARVLWFAPERTPTALAHFVRGLTAALDGIGIAVERRPFHAHLTLARKVAHAPPVSVRPVRWTYAGFALVASELGGRASRYRVLARWPSPGAPSGL